jgi:beta-glucosidase
MAAAHQNVCQIIRQIGAEQGPVEIGFSKNWTYFEPFHRWSPWDQLLASLSHDTFNWFVLRSFLGGRRGNAGTFLGVNYYGRVRFKNTRPLLPTFDLSRERLAEMGVICDDMFERHPGGMEDALRQMQQKYHLPIYVTEHGSASTDETFREWDLHENLTALHRAMERGVDVRGFFYWSLMDNFEWQFGYAKKFGLIAVDFADKNLPRQMKPLGHVYSRICRENAITRNVLRDASDR